MKSPDTAKPSFLHMDFWTDRQRFRARLEMGDDLGVALVADPRVVVDACFAVDRRGLRDLFRHRWFRDVGGKQWQDEEEKCNQRFFHAS